MLLESNAAKVSYDHDVVCFQLIVQNPGQDRFIIGHELIFLL
jgi:hypothetical protein